MKQKNFTTFPVPPSEDKGLFFRGLGGHYFKTALRNFREKKVFSAINILGLATGISASLIIFLIVQYNFSFDKFEKDGDRIYRIVTVSYFGGTEFPNSGVTVPLGKAVQDEVTGLDLTVPFYTGNASKITVPAVNGPEAVFKKEEGQVFVNSRYFKLIGYTWLAGSPESSLNEPYQVVLTESNVKKYFPGLSNDAVIGKELVMDDTVRMTITGIVKDLGQHTDFTFKTFISKPTLETTGLKPGGWEEWSSTNSASQLFIRVSPGADTAKITKQLAAINKKYIKSEPGIGFRTAYFLQPLSDVHFNAKFSNYDLPVAHKPTLYGLIAIALFLLLLGCINFINLTTAQSSQRAKEIGIRKTLGSSRRQLVFQFLSETFVLTLIATVISLLLTPLLLKAFADFIPEGLHVHWLQPHVLLFLLAITILVSLFSGLYPALILSSYKPVSVLKNQVADVNGSSGKIIFRKTLTVSQFIIAQFFIIATIIVGKQISFMLNRDMGFKKDAIVYFSSPYKDTSRTNKGVLLQKLKAIPEIAAISLSGAPPASNGYSSSLLIYKDGKKEIQSDVLIKWADPDYIHLYKIKLLAGTNLPQSDTVHDLLINETYSKMLGFHKPQDAIGKYIEWNNKKDKIAGVVADFNTTSLRSPVKPLLLATDIRSNRTFNIALQPQNAAGTVWKNAMSKMEKAWKEIYPGEDFKATFLDETIAKYYTSEKHISNLLQWATGLAILISCMGLLGLVIYTTNQRKKEIGIRKVIGASIVQIITLLSKDFLKLVLIAFVIAIPIVWIVADKWLQNFALKTDLSIWLFMLGGVLMLLPALLILFLRTWKAANANPVDSLRTE